MSAPDWRSIATEAALQAQCRLDEATESSRIRALVRRIKERGNTPAPSMLRDAVGGAERFGHLIGK
jgi:hypothetical protein